MSVFRIIKERLSAFSIVLIAVFYVVAYIVNGAMNPLAFDVIGYYSYLPQLVIQHDLKPHNLDLIHQMVEKYNMATASLYQFNLLEDGTYVTRYPVGVAILLAPFFFIAHLFALLTGAEADGYSAPYQIMVYVAHMFYLIVGFSYLRKVLRFWFSENITAAALLITGTGTMLMAQGLYGAGMPHALLFCLQIMIVYYVVKWHSEPKHKTSFILGFLIALAAVCRPTEITIVLIFLLWNINSFSAIGKKIKWLFMRKAGWLFFIAGFAIPVLIQMAFWKHTTGSPVYYSYANYGEGFEFLNPPLLESYFHPRSGVLLYSLVLMLAFIGFLIWRKKRDNALPFILFVALAFYVIGSWSVVHYGFRAYTQLFAVMALGLASFLQWCSERKKALRVVMYTVVALLSLFSTFHFLQLMNGVFVLERESWAHYFAVFGDLNAPLSLRDRLRIDRAEHLTLPDPLHDYQLKSVTFYSDMETTDSGARCDTLAHSGKVSILIPDEVPYSPTIGGVFSNLTHKDHAILKCSFWYYSEKPLDSILIRGVIHFIDQGHPYGYHKHIIKDSAGVVNQWNHVEFLYITPDVRRRTDDFIYYIWKEGKGKVFVDDLKIEVYEKRE